MNRLNDLREDKDLLQEDIAKIVNKDRSTYCKYEIEEISITNDLLIKLADYYKVSTDYILYNTDERTTHKLINSITHNNLNLLRKEKNLTQSDLSKILNLTQTCYSKYELSKRNIPNDLLIKLSKYYNTSIDYILNRTSDKKAYNISKLFPKK